MAKLIIEVVSNYEQGLKNILSVVETIVNGVASVGEYRIKAEIVPEESKRE